VSGTPGCQIQRFCGWCCRRSCGTAASLLMSSAPCLNRWRVVRLTAHPAFVFKLTMLCCGRGMGMGCQAGKPRRCSGGDLLGHTALSGSGDSTRIACCRSVASHRRQSMLREQPRRSRGGGYKASVRTCTFSAM
jgi:hypothetical protein